MKYLIIFVSIVLVFQIAMMFVIRWKKKYDKQHNVLLKYNINTPKDAWECLNDPKIPDEDKVQIQKYYSSTMANRA